MNQVLVRDILVMLKQRLIISLKGLSALFIEFEKPNMMATLLALDFERGANPS